MSGARGYSFEWDERKNAANGRKHGVSFHEATSVFADPLSILIEDARHSLEEPRFIVMGLSAAGRLLVVAFTERGPHTRLITAREATPRERRQYEQAS